MKLGITSSAILLMGAAGACVTHETEPARRPQVYNVTEMCTAACTHLKRLNCEPADDDCVSFCESVQSSGYLALPLDCVLESKSKLDVRQCGVDCFESL